MNLIEQLEECSKWGIAFHLYTIVGFPTETKKEALDTLDFILKYAFI